MNVKENPGEGSGFGVWRVQEERSGRCHALVHLIRNVNNDGLSDLFSTLHEQSGALVV